MKSPIRLALALVLLAGWLLPASATGHGAVVRCYAPPGSAGGGGGGGPGPGGPGGGGGGVGTPGGSRWAPGTYNGPGTGWGWTSGNVPYVSGPSGSPFGGMDPTEWGLFWHVNGTPWIDVRSALATPDVQTGSDDYFIGRGERESAARSPRPTREEADELVVPALLEALAGADATDLITGAMVALAKLGTESAHRARIERALLAQVADGNQEIAETATLALGILGGHQALSTLRALALDTAEGRKLVERSSVRTRTQAFAVYGLALTGRASADPMVRRMVVRDLIELASRPEGGLPDVHVAAVIGLGLVPLEHEAPGAQAPDDERAVLDGSAQAGFLIELAGDRRREVGLRAHAVGSLARLADNVDGAHRQAVLALIHDAVRTHSRERDIVRQACVVAAPAFVVLGGEDRTLDAKVVEDLLVSAGDGDSMSRRFAWVALGTIAGSSPVESEAAKDIRRTFAEALKRTGANRERPWVGLGCGLLQRGRLLRGELPDRELADLLRSSLAAAKAPTDAAAYACALGLGRDVEAEEALLGTLGRFTDDEALGHAAVALGMIDGSRPHAALRKLMDQGSARPELVRRVATGLALMGDPAAVPSLVELLARSGTVAGQAAYASALGAAGDRRALGPLLELLRSKDATGSARGFAAVALGSVADPREVPWNTCIADHMNYIAATDTLSNSRGTGVLDIL